MTIPESRSAPPVWRGARVTTARAYPTMRRLESSSAISLNFSAKVAPVAFQKSFAGWPSGPLRNRESEEQALSASIAFFSELFDSLRSSDTVITSTPAVLAFEQTFCICSSSAAV